MNEQEQRQEPERPEGQQPVATAVRQNRMKSGAHVRNVRNPRYNELKQSGPKL